MAQNTNSFDRFWKELKRRKVIHVITVYAATAFVILELVDMVQQPLRLPDWTPALVIVLLCIGFIIAVLLSWVYDITPAGVKKTKPVSAIKHSDQTTAPTSSGWKIATYVSVTIIIALVAFNFISRINLNTDISKLEKSIAVLPFENMSENLEHNWFGDAMTDEIIMQLYKINELIVRSRTSIKQYKTTEKTSPVIGQELDVNYLVEGSAQRFEDKIRIRVQLIQAATDNHLWGEIYEGNWEDILSLQSEIAKQIASELKTVLTAEEIGKIEKEPTMNLEAYELYLKAQYFQNSRDAEGILKSIHYYQGAIRLDANYAIAYCGLAYSNFLLSYYDILPKNEVLPRIKEAATKALELDNQLGEAHFSLALVKELEGDLVGAEEEYLLVIKLNPNIAEVHHRYSYILAWLGKNNEAINEAQIAYELEPSNPVMLRGLGYVYFLNQQFDLAIAECNKCIQIDPKQSFAYAILFWTYNQKSLHDDALTALEKLLIIREKEDIAALVRQTYEDSGYIKAIKTLLDVSKTQSIPWVSGPEYISAEIFNDLPKR